MMTLEPPRGWAADGEEPWAACGLSQRSLTHFLRAARTTVQLQGEVDVLLTGDARLRRLNREFRGRDKATDVLSFPAPPAFAKEHAGDLAVSLQTARRQAAAFGHDLNQEVRVLVLHGLLHLAGMDHETDDGAMAAREDALRTTLRLPKGLIARVDTPATRARVRA